MKRVASHDFGLKTIPLSFSSLNILRSSKALSSPITTIGDLATNGLLLIIGCALTRVFRFELDGFHSSSNGLIIDLVFSYSNFWILTTLFLFISPFSISTFFSGICSTSKGPLLWMCAPSASLNLSLSFFSIFINEFFLVGTFGTNVFVSTCIPPPLKIF
ncbi:unnamed protein product [Meloidogyne enterolobii]|uniref:Uncharacterized protein n=1 Tax=Meloidogyne enterolobii TaxID=390850 RepID=A0ACB0XNH6_MELEN